ncbi:MAG: hypothetical protein HYV40_02345, partial [Candidatus Levybacteria bacterium]|nr:hypothetical protein [Candidatus Levybacteria bacterium]
MLSREAVRHLSETWDMHIGEEREMGAFVKSPVIDVVTFQSPAYQDEYPFRSPFTSGGSWSWEPGIDGEPNHYEQWMTPDIVRYVADEEKTDEVAV